MTYQDRLLTAIADVSGKLRHYTRLSSSNGDKIVFCKRFIQTLDKFLSGFACSYSKSEIKDFNGFCDYADGKNNKEEYAALDAQLAAIVTGDKLSERICECQNHKVF